MKHDLSYENYTPPQSGVDVPPTKEEKFLTDVSELATKNGITDFVIATRDGKYLCKPGDSLVLEEIAAKVVEINGRPENVKMNN